MNRDRALLSKLWRLVRQAQRPKRDEPTTEFHGEQLREWQKLDREILEHFKPPAEALN